METILQIKNLNKKFQTQFALRDINLELKKGDVYGLIGRNGAGKTTLLKTITRLIEATDGTVHLFGSQTNNEWTKSLSRTGAVIETPAAIDSLTAKQNLAYYCKLRGITNASQVIKETLEFVDLSDTGNKKFKSFSLGMKQKMGIAIALLSQPDFLILDEPINSLDPIAIISFRKLINRLNQEKNMTIIISSHILSELYYVASRFGVINNGELIKEITKEEFETLTEEFIVLHTPQVEQASRLLEGQLKQSFKVINNHEINIFTHAHTIAELTKIFVENGISIDGISYFKQDLENYFTNLVEMT